MVKILVIEDDPINRTYIEESIKHLKDDVEVTSVETASEGVFHLFSKDFDIIFLDMMMPKLDGHDFLNIVEDNIKSGNIDIINHRNIVVQTAIESIKELNEISEREIVQQILRKPISVNQIASCLETY